MERTSNARSHVKRDSKRIKYGDNGLKRLDYVIVLADWICSRDNLEIPRLTALHMSAQ
jgi:hypothetical protein